ncbi:hypothetical protein SEA_BLINO_70 [Gordonia phage Blino]|uniref:Uncharacterized protein n=1 Tax=Gordonia phage Blino TaxID=2793696 RepID=A0A7T0Q3N1_9CAUD|nr:hypothetical protein BIZ75_gp69 [Gordonia phage CarolAnn]YP_010114159.1 hypothetical protein KNV70_gp70 [Gordonia phage Blino]AOE44086.1 hypothetical protein SEA_CAROLANN_69 [Gordonia phage CarolAnn]QPL14018.1 hypothetical protein SEA_BLINO_70 [Gordonia phage Blino]
MMTFTRHRLIPVLFNEDIGVRNRCSTDRHEPVTYNPLLDVTYCRCGLITRPGNVGRHPTDRELCDAARGRRDHRLVCPLHGGDHR